MKIKIEQISKDCKALGAYLIGSIREGEGCIMIDFEGVENEESLTEEQKKQIIIDAIKHEVHHALSDFFEIPIEDPDGLCGGTETQEMVVVPLEEHEAMMENKNDEIRHLTEIIYNLQEQIGHRH